MSSSSPPPPNSQSVKSIISIFENQTFNVNNEPIKLVQRTKSLSSLSKRPINKVPERIMQEHNSELAQIEQQIEHLQTKLSNYKLYSRDNHIYYQNQIFFILTDIVNVETNNNTHVINKKSELIYLMKELNKGLNALLPAETHKTKTEATVLVVAKPPEEKRQQVPKIKIREEPPKKEVVVEPPKKESRVESRSPPDDSPAPSVKTLKQLFENKTNESGGSKDVTTTKVSRKFLTFNGGDVSYVPLSERFKSKEGLRNNLVKEDTLDSAEDNKFSRYVPFSEKSKSEDSTFVADYSINFESPPPSLLITNPSKEPSIDSGDDTTGNKFSANSLSSSDSNSSAESDGEQSEKDEEFQSYNVVN